MPREWAETAKQFNKDLHNLVVAIDADLEKAIRLAVMKTFMSIVKRSPVDSGAFRASHGIVTLRDPGENEGIHSGFSGTVDMNAKEALEYCKNKIAGWRWHLGDGDIIIFNNMPYAEKLEYGGYPKSPKKGSYNKKKKQYEIKTQSGFSKQAPQGIYIMAMKEFSERWNKELRKLGY